MMSDSLIDGLESSPQIWSLSQWTFSIVFGNVVNINFTPAMCPWLEEECKTASHLVKWSIHTQHRLVRCMLHHWHEHLKETHPLEIVSRTWTSGQPWNGPFGKGITPARGRKLIMVINHLLTGIILQVKPSSAGSRRQNPATSIDHSQPSRWDPRLISIDHFEVLPGGKQLFESTQKLMEKTK